MYYVVKHTQEETGNTQAIRPHEDRESAIIDFHREIAETLVYPGVKVLGVMAIDDWNNPIQPAFRFERSTEKTPEVMP